MAARVRSVRKDQGSFVARCLSAAWSVVTGIASALGALLVVVCAMVEAMAVIFLLGSMGRR